MSIKMEKELSAYICFTDSLLESIEYIFVRYNII